MTEGTAVPLTIKLEMIYCYKCKIGFAVSQQVRQRWIDTGDTFFCPAGHSQHYTTSTVQKLEEKLEAERKRNARAQQHAEEQRALRRSAEYRLRALKGVITKNKKRLGAGAKA